MSVPSLGFGLCQCLSLVHRCVGFFGFNFGFVNHLGLDHFHYSIITSFEANLKFWGEFNILFGIESLLSVL
jgi:hypothetical protein